MPGASNGRVRSAAPAMNSPFRAAMMAADTGGCQFYSFEADAGLFTESATDIVDRFMDHLNAQPGLGPLSYELNSAVKKDEKRIVLATGSLLLEKGDLPFLLMISPEVRDVDAPEAP
jgi:hypothetical protein